MSEREQDVSQSVGSDVKSKRVFDLEERTAKFGEGVITLAKRLRKDDINQTLGVQAVRSATSVGANYAEADATQTKKDFRHRIGICLRESKETKHWLRMLAKANDAQKVECRKLWQEAQELSLIFSAIIRSSKQ